MSTTRTETTPTLKSLLVENQEYLLAFVQRRGSGLLRYESAEDLLQGIYLRAIGVEDRFTYQGRAAFLGWMKKVAGQHFSSLHDYYSAKKRRGTGSVFRISTSCRLSGPREMRVNPPSPLAGPRTQILRDERHALAWKAVTLQRERDRAILRWVADDVSIRGIAEQLGVSYDAAERARLRAIARFRRVYDFLCRGEKSRAESP